MKPLQQMGQALRWRWLAAELLVVFLGLLAALQVDEWRERQNRMEAETRYLLRLESDLTDFLEDQNKFLALLQKNYAGVKQVSDSLAANEIVGGDEATFERGLIYVGTLPSMNVPRTAYDEMVASGVFTRLNSEELKKALSNLYATHDYSERNFSWWRISIFELESNLATYVSYSSREVAGEDFGLLPNEPQRAVTYDFDALASSNTIKNGFYWATDVHNDWIGQFTAISLLASEALVAVKSELGSRDQGRHQW